MNLLIITPTRGVVQTGNRCTAKAWAGLLGELGHEVRIAETYDGAAADALIALHARRSHDALVRFQANHPGAKRIVALAGTDIYPAPDADTLDSLRRADRIVALQGAAFRLVPEEFHDKLRVIVQAAPAREKADAPRSRDPFVIAVVGHLRAVKDPLRAAWAARLLPGESRISVRHAGAILDDDYEEAVRRELAENSRYQWLGELSRQDVEGLLLDSQAMVLSSFSEGGARVLGESLQCGAPVIAARNEATLALLGEDYPGLYPAGETPVLATLLRRFEEDSTFREDLRRRCATLANQFDPERERDAWRSLLEELAVSSQA